MHTSPQFHIIANWKMHPATMAAATSLWRDIRSVLPRTPHATITVAPPFPFIAPLAHMQTGPPVQLGAQDVSAHAKGAHTGEVSAAMLASLGVTKVLVGHSERRAAGEDNEQVAAKLRAAARAGVQPVLCVGEEERNDRGDHFTAVAAQLTSALEALPKTKQHLLLVAYEPVWAIGTGRTASAEEISEMHLFVRKILSDALGRAKGGRVPILYGGSVDPRSVNAVLGAHPLDGVLVGGASVQPKKFKVIVEAVARREV